MAMFFVFLTLYLWWSEIWSGAYWAYLMHCGRSIRGSVRQSFGLSPTVLWDSVIKDRKSQAVHFLNHTITQSSHQTWGHIVSLTGLVVVEAKMYFALFQTNDDGGIERGSSRSQGLVLPLLESSRHVASEKEQSQKLHLVGWEGELGKSSTIVP